MRSDLTIIAMSIVNYQAASWLGRVTTLIELEATNLPEHSGDDELNALINMQLRTIVVRYVS